MDAINVALIKQRMIEQRITVTELAKRMGINKAHASRILNNKKKNITVHRLVQIMEILNIRPEEMFLI